MKSHKPYAKTKAKIVAGIKRGLADVWAGRTVSHNEATTMIRAEIEEAAGCVDGSVIQKNDIIGVTKSHN